MLSEFKIPLWYTVKRDMIRHDHDVKTAVIDVSVSLIRDYIWIIPFFLIMNDFDLSIYYLGIFGHLICFSIAYEIGYIYTDNIGIENEKASTRNTIYEISVTRKQVYFSILIRLFSLVVLFVLMAPVVTPQVLALYILLLFTYFVYASVHEKIRVFLFVVLRFLKGFIPYGFLLLTLSTKNLLLVTCFLLGTSIFVGIEYGSRKLGFAYINVYKPRYFWLKYVFIVPLGLLLTALYAPISLGTFILYLMVYMVMDVMIMLLKPVKHLIHKLISLKDLPQKK